MAAGIGNEVYLQQHYQTVTSSNISGGFICNAYSCRICLLEFFIVFKTKNRNKKFQWANATEILVCCK